MSGSDPRKWVAVRDAVRAAIDAGELKPGARVNMRQLAIARHVTEQTVSRAMKELAADGLLRHFPTAGYVVARPLPVVV